MQQRRVLLQFFQVERKINFCHRLKINRSDDQLLSTARSIISPRLVTPSSGSSFPGSKAQKILIQIFASTQQIDPSHGSLLRNSGLKLSDFENRIIGQFGFLQLRVVTLQNTDEQFFTAYQSVSVSVSWPGPTPKSQTSLIWNWY